jgi:hypothetical protein
MTGSDCADLMQRGAKAAPIHSEISNAIPFQHQGDPR